MENNYRDHAAIEMPADVFNVYQQYWANDKKEANQRQQRAQEYVENRGNDLERELDEGIRQNEVEDLRKQYQARAESPEVMAAIVRAQSVSQMISNACKEITGNSDWLHSADAKLDQVPMPDSFKQRLNIDVSDQGDEVFADKSFRNLNAQTYLKQRHRVLTTKFMNDEQRLEALTNLNKRFEASTAKALELHNPGRDLGAFSGLDEQGRPLTDKQIEKNLTPKMPTISEIEKMVDEKYLGLKSKQGKKRIGLMQRLDDAETISNKSLASLTSVINNYNVPLYSAFFIGLIEGLHKGGKAGEAWADWSKESLEDSAKALGSAYRNTMTTAKDTKARVGAAIKGVEGVKTGKDKVIRIQIKQPLQVTKEGLSSVALKHKTGKIKPSDLLKELQHSTGDLIKELRADAAPEAKNVLPEMLTVFRKVGVNHLNQLKKEFDSGQLTTLENFEKGYMYDPARCFTLCYSIKFRDDKASEFMPLWRDLAGNYVALTPEETERLSKRIDKEPSLLNEMIQRSKAAGNYLDWDFHIASKRVYINDANEYNSKFQKYYKTLVGFNESVRGATPQEVETTFESIYDKVNKCLHPENLAKHMQVRQDLFKANAVKNGKDPQKVQTVLPKSGGKTRER